MVGPPFTEKAAYGPNHLHFPSSPSFLREKSRLFPTEIPENTLMRSDSVGQLAMLVVAPHPDDAEIFCGGLILRTCSLGYKVGVLDLSQAELSTLGTVAQRQAETARASEMLGLTWRDNLDLPNCNFHEYSCPEHGTDQNAAVRATVKTLRTVRPEVLVIPYHSDRHPDHVQAGKLLQRSLFLAGLLNFREADLPPFTPKLVLLYQFRSLQTPSFIVDISEYVEQKYAVIGCYASQFSHDPDRPSTLLSSALSLTSLRARDTQLGAYIGTAAGEGYLTTAMTRIDDPIQHSRNNPTDAALFFSEHRN